MTTRRVAVKAAGLSLRVNVLTSILKTEMPYDGKYGSRGALKINFRLLHFILPNTVTYFAPSPRGAAKTVKPYLTPGNMQLPN